MDLRERPARQGERHPWEQARLAFFSQVLLDAGLLEKAASLLDVGAGDAWFSRSLLPACASGTRITCWDIEYDEGARANLDLTHNSSVCLRADRPDRQFDLILMLDVLEHIDDDAAFLATTVRENLAPGGALLLSVPAWPSLMSSHDAALQHRRRYRPADLHALIRAAGLSRTRGGGLFHSLLAPRGLAVVRERLFSAPDLAAAPELTWNRGPLVTRLVRGALGFDNWISAVASRAQLSVPGLSSWALCRRSPSSCPATTKSSG